MSNSQKRVIYIYTDGRNYKIGKADRYSESVEEAADERIGEQTTAATYGDFEVVDVLHITNENIDSLFVESYIHTKIQMLGYERLKRNVKKATGDLKTGNSEWFNFRKLNRYEVLDLIRKTFYEVNEKSGQKHYIPRFYQDIVNSLVLDKIASQKNQDNISLALELAPRFGKTLWTLNIFNELSSLMGIKVLVLPTFVLSAESSFTKEISSFSDFENFVMLDPTDPEFTNKVKKSKENNNPIFIAASMHMSKDKIKTYKKTMKIFDSSEIMSVVDEADFGAHTDSSREVLNAVKSKITLLITGTAIERAIRGLSIGDNIIIWTQTDMQMVKKGTHPLLKYTGVGNDIFSDRMNKVLKKYSKNDAMKSCAELPEVEMLKLDLSNVLEIQKLLKGEDQFKWSKALSNISVSETVLKSMMKGLFLRPEMDFSDPLFNPMKYMYLQLRCKLGVTMMFGSFKNKKQHSLFVKLLQDTLGDNFTVKQINGDVTTNKKAEEEVKKIIAKNKLDRKEGIDRKIILVSKDMASRSFSIPEIDTVILMYDRGLISQTAQKISRAFTPGNDLYGNEKTISHVVSLSLDAMREHCPIDLFLLEEAFRISEFDADESMMNPIKNVAACYNVFQASSESQMMKVNLDDYAQFLLEGDSNDFFRIASSSISADPKEILKNLSQESLNRLLESNINNAAKERGKGQTEVSTKDVKTHYNDQNGEENKNSPVVTQRIVSLEEKLMNLLRDINFCAPELCMYDDYENETIESVIDSLSEKKYLHEQMENDLGFSILLAKELKEYLNKRLLNTAISLFLKEENKNFENILL